MIKTLRTGLAAAVATLAGTSALAQSSVTIYGRLNTTVERQKDGDESLTVLQNNASRIGFKGTEDLGGGLKASFVLEHGFSADTGAAAATFWGRESTVGLEGGCGLFGMVHVADRLGEAAMRPQALHLVAHGLEDIIVTDKKVRVLAVQKASLIIEAIHSEEHNFLYVS